MKLTRRTSFCMVFATMFGLVATPSFAEEKLGDLLRESGWDRILGTWVDGDTKGDALKTTYAWRFEDRVVEITTKAGERETVALMGVNAKSGEVYSMGADNEGGGSLGTWKLEKEEATLEVGFVTGQGAEGGLKIRHRLENDDTLIVTIEAPEPITLKLVRAKK